PARRAHGGLAARPAAAARSPAPVGLGPAPGEGPSVTSADDYVVALDLGSSGVKAAVFSVRGECVASAVERYPLHVLGGGGGEQDPADWWDAGVRGHRRAGGGGGGG